MIRRFATKVPLAPTLIQPCSADRLQSSQGNFLWIRANGQLLITLVEAFNAERIMARANHGDGARITVAEPASNNEVLRVLAALAPANVLILSPSVRPTSRRNP